MQLFNQIIYTFYIIEFIIIFILVVKIIDINKICGIIKSMINIYEFQFIIGEYYHTKHMPLNTAFIYTKNYSWKV